MSGGVIPNGPEGITKGALQAATGVDAQSGGIQRLATFDQPTAETLLKAIFVQGNAGLGQVVEVIFTGLRTGISLPLAIIESVAKKLLGLPDDFVFFNVDHALDFLKKVPLASDLVELITGIEDGDLEDLGTWFLNIRRFFGSLNFLDPNFNLQDAAATFVELILWPSNKIAKLIGGFIPMLQIPQLDFSKITSGIINDNFIPGLKQLFNSLVGGLTGGMLPDTQASSDDVFLGMAGQSEAVGSLAVQLAKMKVQITGLTDPTIVVAEEPFEYVANTPTTVVPPATTALWELADTGGISGEARVDGHNLAWDLGQFGGGATAWRHYRYIGPNWENPSDNMITTIVLGDYLTPAVAGAEPSIDVYNRMSKIAGNRSRIVLRLYRLRFRLFWLDAAGNETLIGQESLASQPGTGSIVSVESGIKNANRDHTVTINGLSWTWREAGSLSVLGANNRSRGVGLDAGTNVWLYGTFQTACGNVAHWTSQNTPLA